MNKCKLGNLITLQRGYDITKKEQSDGIYPVVSSSGIQSFHSNFMVKGPGVVIGRKGTLGTAFYIESDFWPHDTTLWVKDFKGNDPYYVYCLLKSLHLEKLDSGSANPTLNRNYVHEIEISKMDIAQQQKLSKTVSLIDFKIDNNIRICSELESMAKTLYDYWFVQFDFPDENGKPYRTSGGEMVWNNQLKREIPKGWEVGKIQQLGTIISGGTPSTKHEEYYCDCGFAWITPNDLSGNAGKMFIGHGERDVTQDGIDNSSATLMPKGSLLLSTRAPIGYLAIAENELCTNQGFKSIVPDAGYSEYYIYYLLQRNIPALEQQGTGTTFKEVSKDTLANFSIVLPVKGVANKFADKIKSNCELRGKLEAENRELTKLRDWLLPMLMNGQATVE